MRTELSPRPLRCIEMRMNLAYVYNIKGHVGKNQMYLYEL